MYLKHLLFRQTINGLLRFSGRILSPYSDAYKISSSFTAPIHRSIYSSGGYGQTFQNLTYPNLAPFLNKYVHSSPETILNDSSTDELESDDSEDGTMNEFLSRFVWIMRGKLVEVDPECDKQTLDGMLSIIVHKVVSEMEKGGLEQMLGAAVATPSVDFSDDLWKTVWEVSNLVLDDMKKARNKEKMKGFLQSEEVKEMSRFAGEIGIRGDMLRELRFKWAREKMEESEFYESLGRLPKEAQAKVDEAVGNEEVVADENKENVVSLPKRHGKIRYRIYGLDLSDPKWTEVADKVHEGEEIIGPQEPKPILGKCEVVTEKILTMKEEDDPSPLLDEWAELLQPSRIDWITLLNRLKEKNTHLYVKVAELVLSKESFQTNICDYSKLIDLHSKEKRFEDAERIVKKMAENGIVPDILTTNVLVHMYSKTGNLEKASEAFEALRSQGCQPDKRIFNSLIMAYVKAGKPDKGERLLTEMEARDNKPKKEICMALLRAYAECGRIDGANRVSMLMDLAGFPPSFESCTLLVKACEQAGDPDQARNTFDHMITSGYKPDDRCTASMIAAYQKKNLLDKAMDLLLQLEKDGFEPGVATYSVLVDWLGSLQLVDEAEQLLGKIAELGGAPPLSVHISLCDMYARTGAEKKALQALAVVEAKKEQLKYEDFERIIKGLTNGGFSQDAKRILELMESRGFAASENLQLSMFQPFRTNRKSKNHQMGTSQLFGTEGAIRDTWKRVR